MWYELQNHTEALPESEGVYLYSLTPSIGGTLYVGKADNLAAALEEELRRPDSPARRLPVRYFTFEKVEEPERAAKRLIEVLRPLSNR